MAVQVLSGKVFLVVTGASQGIGEQIATTFSHLLDTDSEVLLLSRNLEGLKRTASKLPKSLKVNYESVDLSVATADVLNEILHKYLQPDNSGVKKFDRAVIVHNAGSCGDLTKSTLDMTDFDELRKYYDLNVSSPAVLNGVFMKLFDDEVTKLVVNISSHAAIEPMGYAAMYCSGKAARAMYFKVFALEFPQVNVLNYSPGPVETELFDTLVRTTGDKELRRKFTEKRERNEILTTQQTVDKLVEVLRNQEYKSGQHVDYFGRS